MRNEENIFFFKKELMGEGKYFKEIRGFSDSCKLRLWNIYFMILVFFSKLEYLVYF